MRQIDQCPNSAHQPKTVCCLWLPSVLQQTDALRPQALLAYAAELAIVTVALIPCSAPALANDDGIALLDAEAGGDVGRHVGVPLLVPACHAH